MSFCCSQCDFRTNFESALMMHKQLHHEPTRDAFITNDLKKSHTLPGTSSNFLRPPPKPSPSPVRTSSATRLFEKLRARIGRGRALFSHPEDPAEDNNDLCMLSECTSKAFKDDLPLMVTKSDFVARDDRLARETFCCHLCNFEADRITVLDRHLLNDHKIGIDNLLKLVIAKTRDSLSEDTSCDPFKRPYYKLQEVECQLAEGEFMETVAPRTRIMKHAATNTEDTGVPDNFKLITSQLEKLVNCPVEACNQNELFLKMQTLNEYMCKFVSSSNMLKQVLTKELDTKSRSDRTEHRSEHRAEHRAEHRPEPVFDLRLGDSSRDW